MGTPDFAGPSLSALVGSDDEVILGICQPDRPKGRGRSLSPPPSKVLAEQIGLPIWQPESIKTVEALSRLQALSPDLFVVVAFGQMLSPSLLALPRLGCLNVHPSLLPAYRGPAPINWAIINGDKETGVTTMLLDEGMDTGPIFLSRRVKIGIKGDRGGTARSSGNHGRGPAAGNHCRPQGRNPVPRASTRGRGQRLPAAYKIRRSAGLFQNGRTTGLSGPGHGSLARGIFRFPGQTGQIIRGRSRPGPGKSGPGPDPGSGATAHCGRRGQSGRVRTPGGR